MLRSQRARLGFRQESGRLGADPGSHQALMFCPNHGLALSSYRAAIPGTRKVGHIQLVHSQRAWNPKTRLRSQMVRWYPVSAFGCVHKRWEWRRRAHYVRYSWDLTGETVVFRCPQFRKDIGGRGAGEGKLEVVQERATSMVWGLGNLP